MADLLSDDEIRERLGGLEGWSRDGDRITKTFDHGDFVGSVEFVRRLAGPAEEMNHHPDILSHGWNQVRLTLSTHSEGGLTQSDLDMAKRIDALG